MKTTNTTEPVTITSDALARLTPDVDMTLVRAIAEEQGLMEDDGEIWRDRCEFIAIVLADRDLVLTKRALARREATSRTATNPNGEIR